MQGVWRAAFFPLCLWLQMMRTMSGLTWPGLLGMLLAGCSTGSYAERGMGLGAGIGGVTGALVGSQHGNPVAGAAVGAAVGAATGTVVGHSIDDEVAAQEAQLADQLGRSLNGPVTKDQVIEMNSAGVEDSVIIAHIRSHGVRRKPRVEEVISMSKQGVGTEVIKAMEGSAVAGMRPRPPARPAVVVEEHYHGPWWGGPRRAYRSYGRRRRPGVRWGFSFGN